MYNDFFKYFRRSWNPKCFYKKLRIIPDWNYYLTLKKLDIDIKNLFLTNNIAEHLNKIINSKLKRKYPIFLNWREAILQTEEEVNLNFEEIQRKDFSTKLLFYYINFFKNNDTTTDLLNNDEILKLNSLIVSGAKNINIFSLNDIFNISLSQTNNSTSNDSSDSDEDELEEKQKK